MKSPDFGSDLALGYSIKFSGTSCSDFEKKSKYQKYFLGLIKDYF